MDTSILSSQKYTRHALTFQKPSSILPNRPYVEWQRTSPPPASSEVETLPPILDSPASPHPQTPADDDTDDDPEYVDYCPYSETTSATDTLPELSALPKASASTAGPRSPTSPTARWSWYSDDDDDDKYRGVVDDCADAIVRHVRCVMNTCCRARVAKEVRGCFGVLLQDAMEPAFLDDIINQILE